MLLTDKYARWQGGKQQLFLKKIKNICVFPSLTFQSKKSNCYLLSLVVAQGQMYEAPGEDQTHKQ